MSDPEPIDLSKLMSLNLAPDWVGELQKRESAPGEVVWGRAPDNERESRGGGQGQGFGGGGGGRGPRRDGGGFGQDRGGPPRGRQDDRGPRPGGFGGPRPDDRGPRPGGPGGFSGPPRGPRPDDRGPRPDDRGPRPDDRGPRPGGPRPDGPRGPRPDGPRPDRPQGDRGPRPDGPRRDERPGGPPRGPGGPRHDGPRHDGPRGPHPDFRPDDRRGGPHRRFEGRPHIEPLPGWRVRLFAEPKSLEAIVRQIKASSRAYPVFEMGRLFLAGRDRYVVNFSRLPAPPVQRGPKGSPAPEPPPSLDGPDELFHVPADGSLWTNRDEAIRHILNGPVLQNLYRQETITVEPPKGKFTAVAVCGFSGAILGPPNHHSFQTTVARLHREQFYNLPLDRYKSRIRTEKDEALVAKWLEEQSSIVVFVPLTAAEIAAAGAARQAAAKTAAEAGKTAPAAAPAEADAPEASAPADEAKADAAEPAGAPEVPAETSTESGEPAAPGTAELPAPDGESAPEATLETTPEASPEASEAASPAPDSGAPGAEAVFSIPLEPLKSHAAMEAHFLDYHAPNLIKAVTRFSVSGNIPGKLLSPPLLALLRVEVEQQQRFPMQLVQDLCRDLEKENLKFFKRDKKATYVCRTRPHFIEDESHLSPRLRSIVGVIKANVGITVPKLVSVLAPHPSTPPDKVPSVSAEPVAPESKTAVKHPVEAASDGAVSPAETTVPVSEIPAGEPTALQETALEIPAKEPALEATDPAEAILDLVPEILPATESPALETASSPEVPATAEVPAPEAAASPSGESSASPVSQKEPTREEDRSRNPKGPKAPKPPPAPAAPPEPLTAEEIGVLQDLRWLVQEGYVTEYASGELQILGRPPQPPAEKKPKPGPKAEGSPTPVTPAETESTTVPENTSVTEADAPATADNDAPADPTKTQPDPVVDGADELVVTAIGTDEVSEPPIEA